MEIKTGGAQVLNTRPLPAAGQLPTARRTRRAAGKAQQAQQQQQQQLRVCSSKAIDARGPVTSARTAVVPSSVVEPAVEVVEGSADEGAAQQAPAMPQVADLETILQERDACGVGFIAHLKNLQSHTIVEQALQALGCMEHRGACSADDDSGDGAGLMLQVPWKLLKGEFPELNEASSGVGMIFMPNDDALEAQSKAIYEANIAKEGMQLLGWRQVPVKHEVVGRFAKATQPRVWQVMVGGKPGVVGDELERELFVLRKAVEAEKDAKLPADKASDFYTCSLSNRTIIYKGMLRSVVVGQFYQDLKNPAFETSFAIYHRRFSTNTTPKWPLAQPMRILGHNGESLLLDGSGHWVDRAGTARQEQVRTGVEPPEALMALVPEAYRNHPDLVKMYPEAADFYDYWEGIQEGWDGPALLVFGDGKKVGARLDRNGLRPARFWQTKDDLIYVASEVGVLNDVLSNAEQVVAKGRLGPGQMVVADLEEGSFMQNAEISRRVASRLPYKEMLQASLRRLSELGESTFLTDSTMDTPMLLRLQGASGLGAEDAQMVVEAMAQTGNEATYCMGDDIPLAVLSDKPHPLYNYFKQRFAQVTNPPVDPIREGLVMSMEMRLGKRGNLLQPDTDSYRQVLSFEGSKEGGLASAIAALCSQVEAAVKAGCQCVVLSDRADAASMDPKRPPIPALLAVGAVHHHLIRQGLRSDTSIVIDTLSCYTTHHAATLIGYGAHAICPHLAYETARQWRLSSRTQTLVKAGKVPNISVVDAQKNLKKSLEKGIMKILSKMGISLLQCYHGAQIFEAYGLGSDVVDTCFRGSVSRIGGMSLADLQREAESFWVKGFPEKPLTKLEDYGFIQSKPRGEYHANNQAMAKLLHKAIGLGKGSEANPEAYKAYQEHFEQSPVATLRDCLEYNSDRPPIDISEVEPADKIMARFCTGGMSLGAISRETHETIAIAMNRVGGKSNSGEGGEDPGRWLQLTDVDENGLSPSVPYLKGLRNGDIATSRIKQVRADLARLGYRSMDEIIGRADLLRQRQDLKLSKTAGLDLSYLTTYAGPCGLSSERIQQAAHSNGPQLDDEILADPEVMDAIKNDKTVKKSVGIVNVDRSALARVSGAIAKQHGNSGFLGSLHMQLQGSAGQSFACFNIQGMEVHLVGEANDYVGKSMSGGNISIVPPPNSSFQPETASLAGNTCLYGATGGRLFLNGRCGERFAVRNSMAEAVIEGAGDHCCEYMTGGTVVALGPVGRNVAAGMTGGLGFFLDEEGDFCDKVNTEIVAIQKVITSAGALHLRELIQAHVDRTGSSKGKAVLDNWDEMLPKFWQLVPPAEKNTPEVNPDVLPAPQAAAGKAAVSA
ncbi:hypothetical protein DUNSADRAFT_16998 [Dunaliella salina]|uniref:glutamate synthase (ferredoxin) n=1 Tax=Dunaliella salina TaxID=3046 RepID=A0ABQ7G2K3_DUNSA|nr:hypothetical protein DUNSADRAFT_16998 [Dunaliella salina]|eukprot:KAF5828828.1 hypothetical protein DUNSADRAFT_16998 [Dunaliella salina]